MDRYRNQTIGYLWIVILYVSFHLSLGEGFLQRSGAYVCAYPASREHGPHVSDQPTRFAGVSEKAMSLGGVEEEEINLYKSM